MVAHVKNPLTYIWQSDSPPGVKVIALSLLLVLISALPVMLQSLLLTSADSVSVALGWLFAVGALVAHVGFLVGILLLIKDFYFTKK